MGLNFTIPTAKVEVPGGGEFDVRGLSFEDMSFIVGRHGDVLSDLFNEMATNGGAVQATTLAGIASELVKRAPDVAGMAMALAADEDPASEVTFTVAVVKCRRLPISVQLDALTKIGTLTFGTEGGLKKAWETVVELLAGLKGLPQPQAA